MTLPFFTDSGGGSSSLRGAGVGGEVLWNPSLNCSYLAPNYDGNASYLLPRSSNNLVSLKCQGIFSSAKRLAVPKLHPTTTPCLWISSGLHRSKKIITLSPRTQQNKESSTLLRNMPDSSLTPSTQHRFTQARRHAAVPATCLVT